MVHMTSRGAALLALLGEVAVDCSDAPALASLARRCAEIARHFLGSASLDDRLAGSVAFATMCAVAVAGWQLQRQARFADADRAKTVVARYFAQKLSEVTGVGLVTIEGNQKPAVRVRGAHPRAHRR